VSWLDELRRVTMPDGRQLVGATFRGVPFFVETAARTGGRRTVTHEFPLRDDPFVEDLGRRARVFSVEGYVLGDEYLQQRDALLAALEDTAGPGELVHPYYGVRRAVCSSLSVQETIVDGGMARFALEFTEAPAQVVVPTEVTDLAAEVDASADAALVAVEAELEEGLDVDGQPSFAVESLAADLEAIAEQLEESLAGAVTTTQELALLDVEIAAIVGDATSIIREPSETVAALVGVLDALSETVAGAPRAVLQALLDAYDVEAQPEAQGVSSTREQERANQVVVAAALRRVLVIEAARLLPDISYETIEDATADRDAVAERLEEQAETAGDTAYPTLVQLRADILRAIPGDDVLARVVTIERRVAVPSLLLAYQVYGTVEAWEEKVITRNRPQHPGFMSGEIKVLARG
jgi:prophage DNA circulation protein